MPKDVAARIDLSAFVSPSVFEWLAKTGNIADAELLRTFNCGIGMVAVVSKSRADEVMRELAAAGEDPVVIGDVIPPTGEKSDAKGKGEAWAVKFDGRLRFA
jgi:phosphoribosylformylglycinamidine cyclo-ligase